MNALTPILESTRAAVSRRRATRSLETVRAQAERVAAQRTGRSFAAALAGPGLSVIAEHKRRSPSAGVIRHGLDLVDVVAAYQRGGVAALSILTEEASFDGSLADLAAARSVSELPILRKDFVVDPYQVFEALVAGADAILLIVAALDPSRLADLHTAADSLGLDVLVEIHDAAELDTAIAAGARIIGVNNRDLTTLEVDTERTFGLLPRIPAEGIVVAESGFRTSAELERLAAAGVDAVLVGEALMRAPDIEAACRELTGLSAAG